MVLDEIRALAPVDATVVRLSYAKLPVGLWFQEAPEDGSGRQDTLTPR
jgi:hypothetical protein